MSIQEGLGDCDRFNNIIYVDGVQVLPPPNCGVNKQKEVEQSDLKDNGDGRMVCGNTQCVYNVDCR